MDKIAIPCSCGCSVVAIFDWNGLTDDHERFSAEFYTMVRPRFRYRLRTAWRVFRGREHWIHDVNLDSHAVKELQEFLNKRLPIATTYKPSAHRCRNQASSLATDDSTG